MNEQDYLDYLSLSSTLYDKIESDVADLLKAIYYKIIDSKGKTIRVYKETYAPDGNLVHVKEK